jgi:hypothetical protein
MHRYVPIGLLEVLPPQINDRAPAFRGRDELGRSNLTPISLTIVLQKLTVLFFS